MAVWRAVQSGGVRTWAQGRGRACQRRASGCAQAGAGRLAAAEPSYGGQTMYMNPVTGSGSSRGGPRVAGGCTSTRTPAASTASSDLPPFQPLPFSRCPQASLPEHHIVESKPDSQVDDLRWAGAGGAQGARGTGRCVPGGRHLHRTVTPKFITWLGTSTVDGRQLLL